MTIRTETPNALDNSPIPVRAKLAAAWTSFMFLYIYVDYYHLYKPGVIDDLLAGVVFEFDISPALMTVFLALVTIPALMVVLSMALPAGLNRVVNLVVASLYIPVTVFNAVGETWEWAAFYALSIGVELLLLAFILRSAWAWPRVPAASDGSVTAEAREEVRR
ncbi:DUF6326 family protein [Agromyces arachidis]|uniref:DUF6326 family protein n=1 Tax=Agromyces arachidis TaxID=766966 RepID=UPI0040579E98